MRRPSLFVAAFLALGGCSLSLDTAELDPLATTEGFCQTLFGALFTGPCSGATAALAEAEFQARLPLCAAMGRSSMGYDRDAAETCIAGLRSASCATRYDALEGCEAAFVGTVHDGGACADELECENPDAECLNLDAVCPGTCVPPGRSNDPCSPGYPECAAGYYCDDVYETCEGAASVGTLCLAGAVECGTAAYCHSALGTCQPYAMEGERCDGSTLCDWEEGLFCDWNNYVAPAWPTCKRYRSLPIGARCDSGGECVSEAFCDNTAAQPRCVERRGVGAVCGGEEHCMPPLSCLGDTYAGGTTSAGSCGLLRTPGESCTPDSFDCLWGAACVGPPGGESCQAWPDTYDAPCASGWDGGCLGGRCVDDGAGSYTCEAWLSRGEPCTSDRDCGPTARCDVPAGGTQPVCVDSCY